MPAWAPTAAKSVHERGNASALLAGMVPLAATTLNSPEKFRSAPVTAASCLPLPAVSAPVTTVKSGMAMLSFLVPPPVTLRNTSVPWAPAGRAVMIGAGPGRAIAVRTSTSATTRRSFMRSASILGEVEAKVDPEHGLRIFRRQRRQWIGLSDGAQGLLVVVRVAGRLLDAELAHLAVAGDLEDGHRLAPRLGATFPALGDLALHGRQVPGEREIGHVERHCALALRRAGRTSERGRRRLGARFRARRGGGRRGGARRRGARQRRQLFLARPRRGHRTRRKRAVRQAPIGK